MSRTIAACGLFVLSMFVAIPDPVKPDPDSPRPIAAVDSVWIENLTWMEVRDAMRSGKKTVIVATGGIEQNGPYLVTGKHNVVLRGTAEAIARKLGDALVAPIVPFVPEGDLDPPSLHMLYPGSITVSESTYEALLTDICSSFQVHGFEHVILIGDSGGNQNGMKNVARRLGDKWRGGRTRMHYIAEYYDFAAVGKWLDEQGVKQKPEGLHDDFGMTAMMMAVDPTSVRTKQRIAAGKFRINGVDLAPMEKTIEWGKRIIDFRAEATVAAFRKSLASGIVPDGAKLETLWEEGGFTEGVAAAKDGAMYFSDFAQPFDARPARVMKFDPRTKKVTLHCADSKMANGLMFDSRGRLIACCASPLGGMRALVEIKPDGSLRPLVERFKGKRFNSPNDLVIDRHDRIYFSDPKYVGPEKMELKSMDVYRYDSDGSIRVATNAVDKPNGVMLSPDGKTLYVAETDNGTAQAESVTDAKMGRMTLNAFPVRADGSLGKKRVLVNFGDKVGIDGMTVDRQGNIYAAVRSADRFGIRVFSPSGAELAHVKTPSLPTNCCFGVGKDAKTLYITAGGGLYRIRMANAGHHSVAAK